MARTTALLLLLAMCGPAAGQALPEADDLELELAVENDPDDPLPDVPETVYRPPPLREPNAGLNDGAVNLRVGVRYATDYVFRGIEPVEPASGEDSANALTDSTLAFDLGRLPDPFVRVVTNTAEGDDISNFQVIRPTVGLLWETAAFDLIVAHQSFTYPDRDDLDTAEVLLDLRVTDGVFVGEDRPILGPYVFAAYDYDAFEGLYVEAGFRRELGDDGAFGSEGPFGLGNLSLGFEAHAAYVDDYGGFFAPGGPLSGGGGGSGFQHYQLGVFAGYDLNTLLNISRRYGHWSVEGHLAYTDGIDDDLAATTQIWGGAGVVFRY